jgi:hypothetical protein
MNLFSTAIVRILGNLLRKRGLIALSHKRTLPIKASAHAVPNITNAIAIEPMSG